MNIKQAISPDKVAIYIRWSTEDQGEGTTLDVQLEGCRHYVLSQGWTVRPDLIFIDDGYSGANLDRPAMGRLRSLVKDSEVECVVVYKLDRLSRSVADTARLCMDEWDGTCYVKSAREPIDTNSQAGKMFFYTLMNYAEWERSVIRDRTFSGRVRRAQEGRNPGITVPYGYVKKPDSGSFEIVPHEAAVIRRIYEAYRLGSGLLTITNALNAEGTTFRDGRKWQVNTVGYILSNPAYRGDLVWGVRTRNPRFPKRQGEKAVLRRDQPLVQREGVFPPIVSGEEFDLIQAIKQERPCRSRGGGGRSMASEYLLTGFLRCGLCGRPMVGQHNDKRRVNGYYYACIARRDQGKAVCPAAGIQAYRLDDVVVGKLMAMYGSADAKDRCVRMLVGDSVAKMHAAKAELLEIDRKRARIAEKDRRLCQQFNNDEFTLDEFRELRAALLAEGESLKHASQAAEVRIRSLEATLENQAYLAGQVEQLQLWDELTVPQRKHLLRQFLDRVMAAKGDEGLLVDITWKVPTGDAVEVQEATTGD